MEKTSKYWYYPIALIGFVFFMSSSCNKDNENGETVKDIDGNLYHTVTINGRVWMVENLKTTRFNDGTSIPLVTDGIEWENLNTPGFCWYNNDADRYKDEYGALYNWYVIETGKLAPIGWHVSDKYEWLELINYYGGPDIAGGKMKESGTAHWKNPNVGADNSSGFSALPGGHRFCSENFNYIFGSVGEHGYWWTSVEVDSIGAFGFCLYNDDDGVVDITNILQTGNSVRCVKN